MESYPQKSFSREKKAAEISLDRIRRSIEGALEKEKECAEKEPVNQYIRDASRRMILNLPIKPLNLGDQPLKDNIRCHGDYKLPSLRREKLPIRMADESMLDRHKASDDEVIETSDTDEKLHTINQSRPTIRLPPIIIDTGQRNINTGKRKRKNVEHDKQEEKKTPKQHKNSTNKRVFDTSSLSCDEDLSVVMCGRSPAIQETSNELFVSKHGRFKSK